MDFPKSVPGVGLVGDRFVDEDPAIGRQGSLIPSDWGNAVTLELLNVIQAAGLDPSEAQTDQLLEAIRALVPERSAFARITGTQALPASAFGIYALADGGAAATVTLPSTADLVDDTELLLFANHANTASVQVKAGAGQTVQGPAALMGESTTAFMLSVGGDWVRLRSEKAQGRWVIVSGYAVIGNASETVKGLVELATTAEVVAGVDEARAVHPAGLKAVIDGPVGRITALENTHGHLIHTGNATLKGVDNKIILTGIVGALKLEKGDVIRLVGGGGNNARLHTVESITNANEIIVNYEHCGERGNGSLKLIDYTGAITITRIAKWFNAPLGLGQDWVNVKASRVANTAYPNTTGRQIAVSADVNSSAALEVSDANGIWIQLCATLSYGAFAVVPNGREWRVAGSGAFDCVAELR